MKLRTTWHFSFQAWCSTFSTKQPKGTFHPKGNYSLFSFTQDLSQLNEFCRQVEKTMHGSLRYLLWLTSVKIVIKFGNNIIMRQHSACSHCPLKIQDFWDRLTSDRWQVRAHPTSKGTRAHFCLWKHTYRQSLKRSASRLDGTLQY